MPSKHTFLPSQSETKPETTVIFLFLSKLCDEKIVCSWSLVTETGYQTGLIFARFDVTPRPEWFPFACMIPIEDVAPPFGYFATTEIRICVSFFSCFVNWSSFHVSNYSSMRYLNDWMQWFDQFWWAIELKNILDLFWARSNVFCILSWLISHRLTVVSRFRSGQSDVRYRKHQTDTLVGSPAECSTVYTISKQVRPTHSSFAKTTWVPYHLWLKSLHLSLLPFPTTQSKAKQQQQNDWKKETRNERQNVAYHNQGRGKDVQERVEEVGGDKGGSWIAENLGKCEYKRQQTSQRGGGGGRERGRGKRRGPLFSM